MPAGGCLVNRRSSMTSVCADVSHVWTSSLIGWGALWTDFLLHQLFGELFLLLDAGLLGLGLEGCVIEPLVLISQIL